MLKPHPNASWAARLRRCPSIITGADSTLPRVKPFKYVYEKEIVMYAYFKKLDYFSTGGELRLFAMWSAVL